MNTIFHIYIIGIILLVIGGIIYLFLRHQRNLKSRAFLMQEAIRNGDYSFRLSTKGLLFGERALQQALNDMENDIGRLVAQHEVESWQRLTHIPVVLITAFADVQLAIKKARLFRLRW